MAQAVLVVGAVTFTGYVSGWRLDGHAPTWPFLGSGNVSGQVPVGYCLIRNSTLRLARRGRIC